ncbi:type II toxin-antitoxin system HicA family toxin [Anabaena subtropica]|uniref:Type II toxin-antitoxin system HicA family toxin n=1 Tax=Anabaena subtropica FACHB-260 TaxID=2692884 RepID=A0ABR8CM12_9NOST|nr:type II toxin-antitoxin system HicA family toxin [Anabaena subtropica]MBD2343458.1 type II toxin-antitoxin system HicA family toxin [Anabaena subtropica FACHB-260]
MPKKIRELKSLLLQAGFSCRTGKGSHTNWYHPLLPGRVTISGKDGSDAKAYQEKDVNNALQRIEDIKKAQEEEQK